MADSDCKDSELFRKSDFFYLLSSYFLNPEKELAKKLGVLYSKNSDYVANPRILMFVMTSLLQNKLYSQMVSLGQELNDTDRLFFIGVGYIQLNQIDTAINVFEEYFNTIEKVDVNNYEYILFSFSLLHSIKKDTTVIFEEHLANKPFESDLLKAIFRAFAYLFTENIESKISEIAKFPYFELLGLEPNSIKALLEIYLTTGRLEECLSIISDSNINTTNEPSIELIRIECLFRLNRDLEEVIAGFKKFRNNHKIIWDVLQKELNLCIKAEDFKGIKDAAMAGYHEFKTDIFKYYMVYSLDKLEEYNELDKLLDDSFIKSDIDWRKKHDVSLLCVERSKFNLAIEISFETVMADYSNPVVKEAYFHLFNLIHSKSPDAVIFETPDELKNGLWAIVNSPQGKQLVIGNKDPLYQDFLERIIGSRIDKGSLYENSQYELTRIVSKFQGLYIKIYIEIEASDPEESKFQTRSIRFNSFEDFENQLIKEFGKKEELKKIVVEEYFKKYFRSEITFTQLVLNVTANDPISVYEELILSKANWNHGFYVLPKKFIKEISIKKEDIICLDITTVPIIYELSKEHPEILELNYRVSYYLLEYLQYKLKEITTFGKEGGRLHISLSGISFNKLRESQYDERLEYLTNLIAFVKDHLNPMISIKKLEEIPDEQWFRAEWYLKYLMDTYHLSLDGKMVSDDRIFLIGQNISFVSSEYFLERRFPKIFDHILLKLIERHYIGIFINHRVMFNVYMQPIMSKSLLNNILDNLPNRINHDPRIIDEVLEFLKNIYAQGGDKNIIRQVSQSFLKATLTDYPELMQLRKTISNKINSRFQLLGAMEFDIMNDFITVFDIINLERKLK